MCDSWLWNITSFGLLESFLNKIISNTGCFSGRTRIIMERMISENSNVSGEDWNRRRTIIRHGEAVIEEEEVEADDEGGW